MTINKPIIIGLSGCKGSGKNYAARVITDQAHLMGYTVEERAYADPIKNMLKAGLGLSEQHFATQQEKERNIPKYGVSSRYLMQSLGTGWGRDKVNDNLWLIIMDSAIREAVSDIIIVTDVRFDNEASLVRSHKAGHIVQIVPSAFEGTTDEHESEQGITTYGSDYIIPNPRNPSFDRNVINVFNQILTINALKDSGLEVNTNDRVSL